MRPAFPGFFEQALAHRGTYADDLGDPADGHPLSPECEHRFGSPVGGHPVTALLRNGFGSLGTVEACIVIAILYVGSALMFRLAVRLFQHRSVSYHSKASIRTALGTRPDMESTNH